MNVEAQKLELIEWILKLQDASAIKKIMELKGGSFNRKTGNRKVTGSKHRFTYRAKGSKDTSGSPENLLDNITQNKLTELNAFLFNEVDKHINDNWSEEVQNKKYTELSIKHFEKIQDFKKTIKFFLNNELKNLYKLDDFFDDNRDEKKKYPVYSNKITKE